MKQLALMLGVMSVLIAGAGVYGAEEKMDPGASNERTGKAPAPVGDAVSLEAKIGLGYDSNVYEAPNAAYVDYAAIGGPQNVTPVRHSGLFIPIGFKAAYSGELQPAARFLASYRFDRKDYLKSENDNAGEWTHKLKAGMEFIFGKKGRREDTLSFGPFLTMHKETYYDHDTGSDKLTTAGEDVEERYSYDGMGVEAVYRSRTTAMQFGLHAEYESRDYDDPVAVSQYDNTRTIVGGEVEIPIARPIELELGYEWSAVDYDDRHARNALGQLFASAPLLRYTYNRYGVSLRGRMSKDAVVYLDYDRTDRTDEHVGYNDYEKDEYGIRIIYTGIQDTKLRIKLSSWKRDYPNAFAFDKAGQPQKKYDGIDALVKGEYKLTKAWVVWAEYKSEKQNSTDLRYDYDKYQTLVGVSWER